MPRFIPATLVACAALHSIVSVASAAAMDAASGATAGATPPASLEVEPVGSAADFGLFELADGLVVRLGPPPAVRTAHSVYVALIDRKTVRLDLRPISVRAPGYALREQLADGSWRTVDAGAESTYTGRVAGEAGGYVAASWTAEGLLGAVVFSDGGRQWIQPLSDYAIGADPALHVVYRGEDTLCEGACGTPDAAENEAPAGGGTRGGCGGSACVAEIACDADFEYFTARGSSSHATQDRIHAILNVMNHQYVREAQLTHVITTVLVRTAEPDPYTSADSDTLLCELITEWTNNQTAVTRDLTKLFTGRNISGSTIGQAANFAQICDNNGFCTVGLDNGAYCYSQSDFSATFACQTDLAAHEIGHLWGAHHCNCPSSTMNPSITCVNTFNNSVPAGITLSEIDAHADAIACLTALNSPPANDTCDDATVLSGSGTFTGSNVNSSTDGGALGCGSLSGNVGGGRRDVFWRITALANGTVSVDTCGSSFDTMLSIHSGCPATPANQITCNDDCGGACNLQSCVTFSAASGTTYYIRVAGYAGNAGSITLNVSGPFAPSNDDCANALPISDGTATNGTIALATNDGSATCGSSSSNADAWYTFTAGPCGGTLTVDACGTHDRLGQNTGMDTVLSIHTGCPGTTGNELECNDDASPACPGDTGLIRDSRATAALAANQTVFVRVSHFSTAIDDGFFLLNASFVDTLLAPVVTGIGNAAVACGSGAYTGPTPTLTNPMCMTPITWSLVTAPSGVTIDPNTGVVSWPTPTLAGSPHTITIRATNGSGFDDESWLLTVNRLAPLIVPIANDSHACGSAYTGPTPLLSNATCMLPITSWELVAGPAGMTISSSTGVVSWPTPTIAGSPHTITIRANNSAGFDDETWTLTVDRLAPVVNDVPNASHACGGGYTGPIPTLTNAACMTPVTWSLQTGPTGMTINSGTGVVSWPTPTTAGSPHAITIRATNVEGFDDETWRLTVTPVAPVVRALLDLSHNCGGAFTGPTPTTTNPTCMNPVTWSLVTGPAGMTIDPNSGVVSWPEPKIEGSPHTVTIRATNATGFDDESFALTVNRLSPVVNAVPDASTAAASPYTGPTPTLTNATCMTPVTWSLVAGPAGMTINGTSGVVSWPSPTTAGSPHTVTIRATNSIGFDDESWALTVSGGACPGDADGNNVVNQDDIDIVLFNYGTQQPPGTNGDLDGDGDVDQDDIDIVLFNYGTSCP